MALRVNAHREPTSGGSPKKDYKRQYCAPVALLTLATFVGGSSFDPQPLHEEPYLTRTETKQEGKVRVTVAALGADEAKRVFGVPNE